MTGESQRSGRRRWRLMLSLRLAMGAVFLIAVRLAWLAHAARRADHVVITQKDAVKLRNRWPTSVPEPLVAMLDLQWEEGGEDIAAALDTVVTPVERL